MWVGTSTDIQSQKDFAGELEKQIQERTSELEQKNNDLEKMNAELQSFAYVSTHDLQEPLRKIQTFSGRILEKKYEHLTENGKIILKECRRRRTHANINRRPLSLFAHQYRTYF